MHQKLDHRDKGQSFLRAYRIVEAIARSSSPLSATELSEQTGTSRPSIVRLCQTLQHEGLITRALDGKSYIFGLRLCNLGADIMVGGAMMAERSLLLRRAVEEIGETCNIVLHDHGTMVIADRIESNWTVRAAFEVGTRVPLHCSASGKLFVASLPKLNRRRILSALNKSISTSTKKALEAEFEEIRRQGYSIDNEGLREGMVAIAVPIRDSRGRFCATLSAQGATFRFSVDRAKAHFGTLRKVADELQKLIGVA